MKPTFSLTFEEDYVKTQSAWHFHGKHQTLSNPSAVKYINGTLDKGDIEVKFEYWFFHNFQPTIALYSFNSITDFDEFIHSSYLSCANKLQLADKLVVLDEDSPYIDDYSEEGDNWVILK